MEVYEIYVLNDLTKAVRYIPYEFHPGFAEEAAKCLERINDISDKYRFNYCLEEDPKFVLEEHVSLDAFKNSILPELCER